MSILAPKTEYKAIELLAQSLCYIDELATIEMTAEDAFEVRKAESLLRLIVGGYIPNDIICMNAIRKGELYTLMLWPDVKTLLGYECFRYESYLYQTFDKQRHVSMAYFVPVSRLIAINQPG